MASEMVTVARKYGVQLVRGPVVSIPRHEHACDTVDELLSWCKGRVDTRPIAVDLFCGAGGMSVGLADAGFDVVLGVDHDVLALETYAGLHPGLTLDRDLSEHDAVVEVAEVINRLGVTLIAGGPPCQPFSKAGSSKIRSLVQAGDRPSYDKRRDLWESFLEIVVRVRPPAVLLENVPDMAIGADTSIVRTIVATLESSGYAVHTSLLHAWEHGVPQHRQRFILVALAHGVDLEWPKPRQRVVTVGDAIGDLPAVEAGWRPRLGAEGYLPYKRPEAPNAFVRRARRGLRGDAATRVYDQITRPVREDDRMIFSSMDSTTKYSDLDPALKRYRDDIFDDKYKRLGTDELSRSITAHISRDGYWYIHPTQPRTLTVREAARLQTFPDGIRFAGPPSAAFRQIGNAVPPIIAERMGDSILRSVAAGELAKRSTADIASALTGWFSKVTPMRQPWLTAPTAWSSLQGQLLLKRASPAKIEEAWPSIAKLSSPKMSLDSIKLIRAVAKELGRVDALPIVRRAAKWFADRPDDLVSAASMRSGPGVGPHAAAVASLAQTSTGPTPVVVNEGTLRVAARVTGVDVGRRRRGSDGRLAVTRLIGAGSPDNEDRSRQAMAAVLELAVAVCRREPLCGACPIAAQCSYGSAMMESMVSA